VVIALRLCAVHCYANWHVKEKMIDTLAGRLVCGKEATSSMHGAGMYCTVTVGMFQQREWQSDNRRGFCLTVVACLCLSLSSRPGSAQPHPSSSAGPLPFSWRQSHAWVVSFAFHVTYSIPFHSLAFPMYTTIHTLS